jgi:hypothetical protein
MHEFTAANARIYCCEYTNLLPRMHEFTAANARIYCCECTNLLLRMHEFTAANARIYCCECTNLLLRMHELGAHVRLVEFLHSPFSFRLWDLETETETERETERVFTSLPEMPGAPFTLLHGI